MTNKHGDFNIHHMRPEGTLFAFVEKPAS